MKILYGPKKLESPAFVGSGIAAQITPVDRLLIAGTVTNVVARGINVERNAGVAFATDQVLPDGLQDAAITEGVAATLQGETLVFVEVGSVRVTGRVGNRRVALDVDMIQRGGDVVDVKISYVAGTFADVLNSEALVRIAGKDKTSMPVFTAQDHASSTYVRNPDCWAADLHGELTCASPWNSRGGHTRAGTLVTPRHAICARHYAIPNGTILRFVAEDNTVHDRSVVQTSYGLQFNSHGISSDFMVLLLDSDLPASIKPCKILGNDVFDVVDGTRWVEGGFANLALDKQEHAIINPCRGVHWAGMGGQRAEVGSPFSEFSEQIIGGDSGNPMFLAINGELALYTTFLGRYGGSFTGTFEDKLNGVIATLDGMEGVSTGYTLTRVDLSGFPAV